MANGIKEDGFTDTDTLAEAQADGETEDSTGESVNEPQLEEAAIWKNKYIRLLADLENTQKRLTRNAAREIEQEKEALLLELLPVADGLDLALAYISADVDSRNIVR